MGKLVESGTTKYRNGPHSTARRVPVTSQIPQEVAVIYKISNGSGYGNVKMVSYPGKCRTVKSTIL